MKKLLLLIILSLFINGCSKTLQDLQINQSHVLTEGEIRVTDAQQVTVYQAKGYNCEQEVLSSPENNCRVTNFGQICDAPQIKDGDYICSPDTSKLR
jgi:hypothetical protein